MKKQQLFGLGLASTILVSIPMSYATANEMTPQPRSAVQVAVDVDKLTDLSPNHWAYKAVKFLVEELEVMSPKSSKQFKGNDLMIRYELADVFYRVVKKLENASGKDLNKLSNAPDTNMTDVSSAYKTAVNAVVNDYGIMQPMPGKKFMGNEPISRYEMAYELYNYFVLIESQGTSPALARRDRAVELKDLPADHWATKAVKEVVDKYQVMDGYPNDVFMGGKRLNRYEAAATVREFIRYVDTYLIPLIVEPTPVPTPTATPTPVPTPMPVLKAPLKTFDLRLGGDFRLANGSPTDTANLLSNSSYGPNGSLDIWFPQWGWTRFGLSGHGDYMMWHKPDGFTDFDAVNRLTAGGGLKWRLLGAESAEDFSITLGAGYDMQQMGYTQKDDKGSFNRLTHGPTGSLTIEWPWWSAVSWVVDDRFTWFLGDEGAGDRFVWRNDLFAGINIPAYTFFTFEIGYRDTRYVQADDQSKLKGDQGVGANLRFRF